MNHMRLIRGRPLTRSATLLLLFTMLGGARTADAQSEPITPARPIHLFNGRDLSGFETWIPEHGRDDPSRVFSVVRNIDGYPALRISGEHRGSLITEEAYANYRLVAEYRWGPVTWEWNYGKYTRAHRARDNGIQIHCQGEVGNWRKHRNAAFMYGIQYQIREGRVGDFILMGGWKSDGTPMAGPEITIRAVEDRNGDYRYHWNGEPVRATDQRDQQDRVRQVHWYGHDPDWINLKGYRGNGDLERPYGEWNRVEIIARPDSVIYKLNGAVVNVGADPSVTAGRILLQSEFAEIYYRRLDLMPLDD